MFLSKVWTDWKEQLAIVQPNKDLAQKTSNHFITVHYPFHALAGRRFWTLTVKQGPPPVYVVQFDEDMSHTLKIPVWMTTPAASHYSIKELPRIDVPHLLEVAKIVAASLGQQTDKCEKLLAKDQPKEKNADGEEKSETDHNPSGCAAEKVGSANTDSRRNQKGRRRTAPQDRDN